jgi:hypothetical protein
MQSSTGALPMPKCSICWLIALNLVLLGWRLRFSGSFRLQALGVVPLIYWILGGLFMTRQPIAEPADDVMEGAE